MIGAIVIEIVNSKYFAPVHLNQGGGGLVIVSVPPVKDFSLPRLHSHMAGSVATPEQGQKVDIF